MKQLDKDILELIERGEVNWNDLSGTYQLSEEFIEKYKDQLDWYYISRYQILSGEFIGKYKDKVYWYNISYDQTLSEEFIEKYKNEVIWYVISHAQKLSEEFINRNKDKINFHCLLSNKGLADYSKDTQDLILEEIIDDFPKLEELTPYMLEQYNKLSIML